MQNPPSGELCSSVGLADISPSQLVGMLTQKNKLKKLVYRQLRICALCPFRKLAQETSGLRMISPLSSSRGVSSAGQFQRSVGLRSARVSQLPLVSSGGAL